MFVDFYVWDERVGRMAIFEDKAFPRLSSSGYQFHVANLDLMACLCPVDPNMWT